MKQIPLSQGKFAMVDDDMFDYLNQWKWNLRKTKRNCYAKRWDSKNKKTIYMHLIILPSETGLLVDHKDHDGLNNQKHNLRIATSSQNCANRPSRVNSTSKYLGVCKHSATNKWHAQITINYQKKYLGVFMTEEAAALAYNEAAIKYFGEFANINKIESH